MKYGRWTTIGDPFHSGMAKEKKLYIRCRCDCGTERAVQVNNLRSGTSQSCGCLKRKIARDRIVRPHGLAVAKHLFGRYKAGAIKRNLIFEISFDRFLQLTKKDCFYCGQAPEQELGLFNKAGELRVNGTYIYNGIDRYDNNLGYTIENCVPCCFRCNRSKGDGTIEDMVAWAKRLIASKEMT